MGTNPAADPIFYLLHGHADVIFERWVRARLEVLSRMHRLMERAWR